VICLYRDKFNKGWTQTGMARRNNHKVIDVLKGVQEPKLQIPEV